VANSSLNLSVEPDSNRQYHYLQPSTFWSIRQEFPRALSILIICISLAVPLLVWAVISYAGLTPAMFLPTPIAVLQSGMKMFSENNLITDILVSCGRVLTGFLASAVIGVPIGIAMGTFNSMESVFAPFVGTVRYMPVTAFVPLIVIWVGLGEASKILIVTLGVVLYNAIMVADAVKFIPDEMINVAYTLGATRREVLFKVIIPAIFPNVLDTLRVNISGAWNYLVVAELVAAQSGLGFRIIQAQRFLQTEKVLFCIAIIGLIGLIIDYALKWISQKLTPWADQTRH
jgi:NitT/TauT family transport system permease protein